MESTADIREVNQSLFTPSITAGATKAEIKEGAELFVQSVLEVGNFFKVAEGLAAIEEFTDKIRKDERFQEGLLEELSKHNGKLQTSSGAKIEAAEVGIKYDYSQDSEWVALCHEAEKIKAALKAREDRLKKIPAGKLLVDEETGETLVGPAKSSRSSYKVTLAK